MRRLNSDALKATDYFNQGAKVRLSIPMDGSIWTILPLSWQLCVQNSDLCCSPKHVLHCLWYTLSQKHRKHVYMHVRWNLSIHTQPLYVCIFGQQVHGIVYSVYHVAI